MPRILRRASLTAMWMPEKSKAYLRGAKARTREQLDAALAAAIRLVTKSDIRGWFEHGGHSLARE